MPSRALPEALHLRRPIYLIMTAERCSRCQALTCVVALGTGDVWSEDWGNDDGTEGDPLAAVVSEVSSELPAAIVAAARQLNPGYGRTGGIYRNRCKCGAWFEEEDLHGCPGSAFHPTDAEFEVTWVRELEGVEEDVAVQGQLSIGILGELLEAGRAAVAVPASLMP